MADRSDYDLLTASEVARVFPVDEKTLRRWIDDGYFPGPTVYGRQSRWRWGMVKRWMEATEFLQGLGLTRLVPPDEDGTPRGHLGTPEGHLGTSGDIDPPGPSGSKKPR